MNAATAMQHGQKLNTRKNKSFMIWLMVCEQNRQMLKNTEYQRIYFARVQKVILSKKYRSWLPKESFSPESGGSVNPSTAMDAINIHELIRLFVIKSAIICMAILIQMVYLPINTHGT